MASSVNRVFKLERTSGREVLDFVSRAKVKHLAVGTKKIPIAIRGSFLLFAFTLPFQGLDLPIDQVSLAKISGLLFFACYFSYHNPLSRERSFPPIPAVMWWFAGYIAIYLLHGFFVDERFIPAWSVGFRILVQLMVLFWCASDLLREENVAKSFLFTYSLAAVIFAVGLTLNIPGFVTNVESSRLESDFSGNPNQIAQIMASAAVILLGFFLTAVSKHIVTKIVLMVLIFPPLIVIAQTASRSGMLAFLTGCFVYAVPFLKSKQKLVVVLSVSVTVMTAGYLAVNNPFFYERIQQSYIEGDLAGREIITPVAIELILERPLFGWHPIELLYEIASRAGWRNISDPHSLYLHLFLEVGVVGALPFLIGLWLCVRAAWRARSGDLGLLPFALLITLLVFSMSGTQLYDKQLWTVLALAVAAESSLAKGLRNRISVVLK